MRVVWETLRKYPALLMLVLVYLASTAWVFTTYLAGRGGTGPDHKIILRIAHWQLEPGIVRAVNNAIADYEKLKKSQGVDVQVIQIPVPEEGYFQYVNTQLIGRTAPDMIECGLGGSQDLWRKFYARYFMLLDEYVDKPNPYNAGTAFEKTPWRDTYFDQMQGGYEENLQSYFRVPLSAFTVRLYYNVGQIRQVWDPAKRGSDFPTTFADFMQLCKDLRAAAKARGEKQFVPIAGSKYSFERFGLIYQTAMTADYLDRLDTNLDGTVSEMEYSAPFYSGAMKLTEPAIRGDFQMMRDVADQSPPGATSMDRDQAVPLFLQQHAAMIPTGSWDFSTLFEGAKVSGFKLAVADFPLPAKSNPQFGKYVAGQPSEASTKGAFPFAITKTSPNRDMALDFLQFLSSVKENEKLNREMYWLPAILDPATGKPEPRKELKPFTPRVKGYPNVLQYYGTGTKLDYDQQSPLYLSGNKTFDQFVTDYMKEYRHDMPLGVGSYYRSLEQTLEQQMQFAALRRAALTGAEGAAEAITGEPQVQLKRILEAYASQRDARDHEMRTWVDNVRLYDKTKAAR